MHRKTPVPESLFLIKLKALRPATLLKKRLCHRCFPVNFAKFLRTPSPYRTAHEIFCASLIIAKFLKLHISVVSINEHYISKLLEEKEEELEELNQRATQRSD